MRRVPGLLLPRIVFTLATGLESRPICVSDHLRRAEGTAQTKGLSRRFARFVTHPEREPSIYMNHCSSPLHPYRDDQDNRTPFGHHCLHHVGWCGTIRISPGT